MLKIQIEKENSTPSTSQSQINLFDMKSLHKIPEIRPTHLFTQGFEMFNIITALYSIWLLFKFAFAVKVYLYTCEENVFDQFSLLVAFHSLSGLAYYFSVYRKISRQNIKLQIAKGLKSID